MKKRDRKVVSSNHGYAFKTNPDLLEPYSQRID